MPATKPVLMPKPSILCLWCNGVMSWGENDICYDLCDRCVPRALEALDARLAENARHRHRQVARRHLSIPAHG